jgi:RimJ/RimL family protein N-acetyltransferase
MMIRRRTDDLALLTERLRLRPIGLGDLESCATLGADERVMSPLGGAATFERSRGWLQRLVTHWEKAGFGRYVVERSGVFVGVVGLSRDDFDTGIVPGVEIAWRLAYEHWGQGYATEAARAVLHEGFGRFGLREIVGVTTLDNRRSRRVMERLGMIHRPADTFEDPRVPEGDPHRTLIAYRIGKPCGDASSA